MKKTHKRTRKDYTNYYGGDGNEFYGIHEEGDRIKIDLKRMKKVCQEIGLTDTQLMDAIEQASQIPRHTSYFRPAKKKENRLYYQRI